MKRERERDLFDCFTASQSNSSSTATSIHVRSFSFSRIFFLFFLFSPLPSACYFCNVLFFVHIFHRIMKETNARAKGSCKTFFPPPFKIPFCFTFLSLSLSFFPLS